MSPDLISLTALGCSWMFWSGAIWKFFEKVESVVSEDGKLKVSNWLRGLEPAAIFIIWGKTFETAFDSVFSTRHFSWRCIRHSCIASILSVIAVSLIWGILRPAEFMSFLTGGEMQDAWFVFPLFLLFTNIVPDYFSIMESRWVIKCISQSHSPVRVTLWLLADLVATAVIALVAFSTVFAIYIEYAIGLFSQGLWSEFLTGITLIVEYGLTLRSLEHEDLTPGVFFYSTFFTSVWVLLHSSSVFLMRFSQMIGTASSALKIILNIDQKPFLSVASIMIMVVTALHLAALPFTLW